MNTLRRFTDFVLSKRWPTMTIVFVTGFIPFLSSFNMVLMSIAPLFSSLGLLMIGLVTLRKGAYEGSLMALAALSSAVILYLLSNVTMNEANLALIALGLVGSIIFAIWGLSVVLRRYSSWGLVFDIVLIVSIIGIFLLHVFVPNIQAWWIENITAFFNQSSELMNQNETNPLTSDQERSVIKYISMFATGLLVTVILLYNVLLHLLFSRWWQAYIFNPGGLRMELHQIRMGYISGILFILVYVLGMWGYPLGIDCLPVLYACFFFAGLSLIHCLIQPLKKRWLWLLLAYIVIILSIRQSVVLVSFMAMLDTWLDIRRRFRRVA